MLWHGIEKRWRGSGMLNEKRDNAVTRCRVQIHPDTPPPPFHKFLSNGKKQKLISPSLVTSRKISIAIKNLLCAISRMLKRKTCFEMRMNNDFFFPLSSLHIASVTNRRYRWLLFPQARFVYVSLKATRRVFHPLDCPFFYSTQWDNVWMMRETTGHARLLFLVPIFFSPPGGSTLCKKKKIWNHAVSTSWFWRHLVRN